MTACSELTTPALPFPPLLSLKVKAVSANHLQLIDPANMRAMVSTVLAVTDCLIKVTATCINKDLSLRQNPPRLLTTGP